MGQPLKFVDYFRHTIAPSGMEMGTSSVPLTSATNEQEWLSCYFESSGQTSYGMRIQIEKTSATAGAPRAVTLRTILGHSSGFAPQGANSVDARVTLETGNTGISGEMHAMESQCRVDAQSRAVNGTYAAHKFTNNFGTGNTMPTDTYFLRLYDAGNVKTPFLFGLTGSTAGSGNLLYHETLKVRIATSTRYIPLSTEEGTYTTAYPIVSTNTTASTTTATGSIHTDGGLGVAGAIFVGGTVSSSNTTSGFAATGAATQGLLISGACTNGINITSTGTTMGLLYNVDMTTQIGSNIEGIKVILERTADIAVGTSNILGAEFIIKQGSDSYAAGMAPQITGVRIAMGGANTKATVYGLKCETQSSGFVNYLGMFSVNAGCTLGSGGAVVTVRSYVAADDLLKIEQIGATTAARGLLICDNVGTGTMTNVIEIDARNSDALIKFSSGNGSLVSVVADSMTANPQGDVEAGYITVVVGANTYQIPIYAA